jgi:hypothetical protein
LWWGIIQHHGNVFSLKALLLLQTAKAGQGGIEVEQFHEGMANGGLLARGTYNERHLGGFVAEAHLGPKVMLAQMIAMVAGENDDGLVPQACLVESSQHLAHLGVHVGDRGIVTTDGFFWRRISIFIFELVQ